jgi:hypothetical protein
LLEKVSFGLSILALVTSAALAMRQLVLSRHTNMLPILIDVYQEYRDVEFKSHVFYVLTKLRTDHEPTQTGFRFLPEPASTHVRVTSHFFDNLGVLVRSGAVDERFIISFTGDTIESVWTVLEPYIEQERVFKDGDYQEFFEDLVVRVRKNPPWRVRRAMKLQKVK